MITPEEIQLRIKPYIHNRLREYYPPQTLFIKGIVGYNSLPRSIAHGYVRISRTLNTTQIFNLLIVQRFRVNACW